MAQEKREFDKQMLQLDAEIRRLEAEYNMYFAGRLPRPPFETKNRVTALVKRHDNSYIQNTADRFRFESLQARFYKFIEIIERQLTNRELGRVTFGKRAPQAEVPEPKAASGEAGAPPESRQSAQGGARATAEAKAEKADERVVKFNKADATADKRVKELYEQLAAAKKQVGEAPVAYERVQALVKAQVSKFADDGTNVAFKIALKDGKVSLTVKPEKE